MSTAVQTAAPPRHRPRPTPADGPRSLSLAARWGDRSVATKVLTAVGIATAVAVLIGVLGMQALGAAADRTERLYGDNVQAVHHPRGRSASTRVGPPPAAPGR